MGFTEQEIHANANVAVVTEAMVNRFRRGQDPIGKRIKTGGLTSNWPWLAIVGVVGDLKYRGLPENPTSDPDLFQVANERANGFAVLVRTRIDPAATIPAVRAALTEVEPSIVIYDASTMEASVGRETARSRFMGWLMAIFAGSALLLATVGIYGVMSYTVSRQRREIGVRIALGAGGGAVLQAIAGRGMALVAIGWALGGAAALGLTRLMSSVLYGVKPGDPATYIAASLTIAAVALAACAIPAQRASRIDPAEALRNE